MNHFPPKSLTQISRSNFQNSPRGERPNSATGVEALFQMVQLDTHGRHRGKALGHLLLLWRRGSREMTEHIYIYIIHIYMHVYIFYIEYLSYKWTLKKTYYIYMVYLYIYIYIYILYYIYLYIYIWWNIWVSRLLEVLFTDADHQLGLVRSSHVLLVGSSKCHCHVRWLAPLFSSQTNITVFQAAPGHASQIQMKPRCNRIQGGPLSLWSPGKKQLTHGFWWFSIDID